MMRESQERWRDREGVEKKETEGEGESGGWGGDDRGDSENVERGENVQRGCR